MMLRYVEEEDMLHRTFADGARTLDFVYARAFVGSWKLAEVMEIHEGDAPEDLPEEENQSLYGAGESILTFLPDGKATDEITDGPDKAVTEGTWEMTEPDCFTWKEDTMETEFHYFRVDDTIYRDFKDEAPDAAHAHLRFVYERVIPEPEAEEAAPAAPQPATPQAATQQAPQPAAPQAPQPAADAGDELIADGQIFTGHEMTLYDPYTGTPVLVKELNQGGWANDLTGVIYYQEEGGGDHFYGNDGSVLISEWLYYNSPAEEDELIADGQIFTGHEMVLYDPNTGAAVLVKELNQGGWANDLTGVIYYQEEGGGDHFYGNDGSVLISEWLYYNSPTEDDELIADGQIFSGETVVLTNIRTGEMIRVQGLNQGGYADPETGILYYQDATDPMFYYGTDGSDWTAN